MRTHSKTVELLFSLGLAVTISACGTDAPDSADPAASPESSPAAETAMQHEGGEGGEGNTSTGNSDVDYMISLGLMKGHLMVGKELLDQQQPEQAEPHIGHPVEELYADVEGELQQRQAKDFKGTLTQLHETVIAKPTDPQVTQLYDQAMQDIDQAIETIPAEERESPEFILPVINGLLETAAAEYEAAIANDQIVEAIEYQDSRGFVMYADMLYQPIAEQMAQEHTEAHDAITTAMSDLVMAWPSVTPPDAPVMTPDQVSELVQTIEAGSEQVVAADG